MNSTIKRHISAFIGASVIGLVAWPATASAAERAVPAFSVAPTSLDFGSLFVEATTTIDVVITNISGTSQTPSMAGGAPLDAANFGGSQDCAGKTFAPGEHCTFRYEFHPASSGTKNSNTSIDIDDQHVAISMTGVGLFPFSVAPVNLDFGTVAVGATAALDVVITNISGISQTPSMAGGAAGDANYDGSQNCAGKTFAPGESCAFTYVFQPTSTGTKNVNTSIDIDDQHFAISLTGVGAPPTSSSPTTGAAPTASAAPVAGGGLPTTGPALPLMIASGSILIIVGIGLLAITWARRRRTA